MSSPTPARYGQPLTQPEITILRYVANGLSNAAIGRATFISEDTVKSHLQRAFRKLGATNRAHAVGLAALAGHVTRSDIRPDLERAS
ncbi:helix-turn-helix transcriptional regulator [Kitasatospora sp. NBC_00070]|uniref:helix-turn-helix domain-containing protein n=1 Tax=Kitasatospora sp. NBC_00070 TaxID=2975962 RepID=UPI00324BCC2C